MVIEYRIATTRGLVKNTLTAIHSTPPHRDVKHKYILSEVSSFVLVVLVVCTIQHNDVTYEDVCNLIANFRGICAHSTRCISQTFSGQKGGDPK